MNVDDEAAIGQQWSREQDKAFENALAMYIDDDNIDSNMWEEIAAAVEGKTVEEIKQHYEVLFDDVSQIEAGGVPLPTYSDCSWDECNDGGRGQERRKGIPWSEEEHRLFLNGLDKYGKGDWRSISRLHVKSRTPTQVASHAQKYFIRMNSSKNNDRRRSSIHDVPYIGNVGSLAPGPITEQSIGNHRMSL